MSVSQCFPADLCNCGDLCNGPVKVCQTTRLPFHSGMVCFDSMRKHYNAGSTEVTAAAADVAQLLLLQCMQHCCNVVPEQSFGETVPATPSCQGLYECQSPCHAKMQGCCAAAAGRAPCAVVSADSRLDVETVEFDQRPGSVASNLSGSGSWRSVRCGQGTAAAMHLSWQVSTFATHNVCEACHEVLQLAARNLCPVVACISALVFCNVQCNLQRHCCN